MAIPQLKRVTVKIGYSTDDSFSSDATYITKKGASLPKDVLLIAIDELSRLAALYGYGDEAKDAFDDAQRRVAEWKANNQALINGNDND